MFRASFYVLAGALKPQPGLTNFQGIGCDAASENQRFKGIPEPLNLVNNYSV